MPHSELKQLWNGVQILENLKHIKLSWSRQLVKVPDLSRAPKLECIHLDDCTSLIEVPPLNSQRHLESLTLGGCTLIKSFPKISWNIRYLNISRTAIAELPSSIESFENLVELMLWVCQHIKNLPTLPGNIEKLDVGGSSIKHVSSSSIEGLHRLNFFKLKSLLGLNLNGCSRLKEFTEAPSNFKETEIQDLPDSFMMEKLFGLRRGDLSWRKKNRVYSKLGL